MNFKKIILSLTVLAAVVLGSLSALAQPYITNTATANGAYLPNAAAANAYPAYVVRSSQLNMGLQAGTFTTVSGGLYTNTFNTTYVYTAVPIVTATQTGATGTVTNLVTSTTLTNFIYQSGAVGTVVNYTVIGR